MVTFHRACLYLEWVLDIGTISIYGANFGSFSDLRWNFAIPFAESNI